MLKRNGRARQRTNAFDKFYYSNKLDLSGTNGYIGGRPDRPRKWLVSVNRKF